MADRRPKPSADLACWLNFTGRTLQRGVALRAGGVRPADVGAPGLGLGVVLVVAFELGQADGLEEAALAWQGQELVLRREQRVVRAQADAIGHEAGPGR